MKTHKTLKEKESELKKLGFKKLVSGDIYYFEKIKDNHLVFTADPETSSYVLEIQDMRKGYIYHAIELKRFKNQELFLKSFVKAKITF